MQVLECCPHNKGFDYASGYVAFVECFFQDLDFCSDAFTDRKGHFEVDLSVVMELSLKTLQKSFNQLPADQRKNYWLGISAGAEVSENVLKLAFEITTTNEAA